MLHLKKRRILGSHPRARGRGQALVEFALLGLLLAMLLAGAVDLGRAYYTSVVVTNMAGEGAAYASIYPDLDTNYPQSQQCSQYTLEPNNSIQYRARKVANDRGLVISDSTTRITVSILGADGNPLPCSNRCTGTAITVKVTYTINDLFLPGLLGMNNITISKSATQYITRNAWAATCS
jgi:Flp pilus assembly protein TadG